MRLCSFLCTTRTNVIKEDIPFDFLEEENIVVMLTEGRATCRRKNWVGIMAPLNKTTRIKLNDGTGHMK